MDCDCCLAVLYCLLQHPDLKLMLSHPGTLGEYLMQHERRPEACWDECSSVAPDSQEAAELAEIQPAIEKMLGDLKLSEIEKAVLAEEFAIVFPDFREHVSLFLPVMQVGNESCIGTSPWPHPSWMEGLPTPRQLQPGEPLGNKDKKLAMCGRDPYAEACAAAAENGNLEEFLEQVAYELSGNDEVEAGN